MLLLPSIQPLTIWIFCNGALSGSRVAQTTKVGDRPSGWDEQQEFLFGVNAILDAVQALIDRRAAGGS